MEKFDLATAVRMLDSVSYEDIDIGFESETDKTEVEMDENNNMDLFVESDFESILESNTGSFQYDQDNIPNSDNKESDKANPNIVTIDSSEIPGSSKESDGIITPVRGRKRFKNEDQWKQNVRKRRRQMGQEYESTAGKQVSARMVKVKKDCQGKCKFKCAQYFSTKDRQCIFNHFWSLTDSEKSTFYANTTDKEIKNRGSKVNSRRKFSYKYFLRQNIERIRVCKEFYLTTLDINQRRIEWFHSKVSEKAKLEDLRGKHSKRKVPTEDVKCIKEHINSFNRIPSHYCRASSDKEFLEPGLNVSKMHALYSDKCKANGRKVQPIHVYRNIFKTEFNIGFYTPKKDRCDTCEEWKILQQKKEIPPVMKTKYDDHMKDRIETKTERDSDRRSDHLVICFDLENVVACPRSNVSNFFYKRKLNVFNLTGHCSRNKKGYNVVWNEVVSGRGANEIASALHLILEKVLEEYPDTSEITLWSDSCVSQNRNSIMCFSLKVFMMNHPSVKKIVQKFCTPGHSSIQEVDNIHSHIEKRLKISEIYSPLSFMRVLKTVRNDFMEVIQMDKRHIYDFQAAAGGLNFKVIPFTRVKSIVLYSELTYHVGYKVSFNEGSSFQETAIAKETRNVFSNKRNFPKACNLKKETFLTKEKKKDLESMLKFMPVSDAAFMENLCKIGNLREDQPKKS